MLRARIAPAIPDASGMSLPPRLRRWLTGYPMAVVILACWWALAVSGETGKSPAFDEIAHLTAGYSYWLTGDYRLHPENGVLPQRWASLPLLLGQYRFPDLDQPAWRSSRPKMPVWAGMRMSLSQSKSV